MSRRQRDKSRQACAFVSERVFNDLNQQLIAFFDETAYVWQLVIIAVA